MKNLLILVLSIIMLSCAMKPKVEKPKDDFLKVSEYKQEAPKETPKAVSPTPTVMPIATTGSSYWYVSFTHSYLDNEKNFNADSWHWVVALSTPYFDFVEARKQLPDEIKGRVFYEFIMQVNKESFDTFFKFREENQKIPL